MHSCRIESQEANTLNLFLNVSVLEFYKEELELTVPSEDQATNLFHLTSKKQSEEAIELLLQTKNVRIERIVSSGQSSPEDYWYDQSESEWVVVLAGSGTLELKDPDEIVQLGIGEYIYIPAHRQHRVKSTSKDTETIWLAVFFQE